MSQRMELNQDMGMDQAIHGVTNPISDGTTTSDLNAAVLLRAVTRRLYLSHSFSAWNSRSFEFGSTLFLASIFPNTLLPLSIYALIRSASAIVIGPAIGNAIDRRGRLAVVRFSIVGGRLAVIASSMLFWALYRFSWITPTARWALFAALTLLSCVEKPCSVLNLVSIERDWVVVIAGGDEDNLRALNARMRRIDLVCKLAGPLFIALVDGASTNIAILLTLALNAVSLPMEYFAIARVYQQVPLLQEAKTRPVPAETITGEEGLSSSRRVSRAVQKLQELCHTFVFYYNHPAFLPSFSLALLYLTVLSFSGQMVTYLLSAGYTSFIIALTRTISVVFELSATWIAPRLMKRIHPLRSGMWFLSWQMMWLAFAVAFFWAEQTPIVAASGLVAGTIVSRIGLWGFDLSAQSIIQEEVQSDQRGSFSSTEVAFQNLFELLSYAITIVWSRPDQFRYPIIVSAVAVYAAGGLYGRFLRKRRGHLLHAPQCMKPRSYNSDENVA